MTSKSKSNRVSETQDPEVQEALDFIDDGGIGGGAPAGAGSGGSQDAESDTAPVFIGVDGQTGQPLPAPRGWAELKKMALAQTHEVHTLPELKKAKDHEKAVAKAQTENRGRPPQGVDSKDLGSAGWGILFAEDVGQDVRDALAPLIEHRKSQCIAEDGKILHRVFAGDTAAFPGATAVEWLEHVGIGPGVGNVEEVPYYLTVVGDPKTLPFDFDFELGISSYAVGRLWFDRAEDFWRYAQNVVEAETSTKLREKKLSFFGTEHDRDVTTLIQHFLMPSLINHFTKKNKGWEIEEALGDEADKKCMADILRDAPSILFHAGHGLGPGEGVGSLLCAGYPGSHAWRRKGNKDLPREWIFGPKDIPAEADLRGMVAVLFGCYTAGVPSHDSFARENAQRLGEPRMAALASRLLSRKNGALAVLGHIDRAFIDSFLWQHEWPQPQGFKSVLGALLDGEPIGAAASYLQHRYTALAIELLRMKGRLLKHKSVDKDRFTRAWMAERDARAYLVFGDPATRPMVD